MRHIHTDIARKAFDFSSIDEGFDAFASTHCKGLSPTQLLTDVWDRILLGHNQSSPVCNPGAPILWKIDTAHLVVFYLVFDDLVFVTWVLSRQTGRYFHSRRLSALLG